MTNQMKTYFGARSRTLANGSAQIQPSNPCVHRKRSRIWVAIGALKQLDVYVWCP